MIRIARNASGQKVRVFIPDVTAEMRAGRSGAWMRLHCGDRVSDKHDPRHEGRVEAIINTTVTVKWDGTGWRSEVPIERIERL